MTSITNVSISYTSKNSSSLDIEVLSFFLFLPATVIDGIKNSAMAAAFDSFTQEIRRMVSVLIQCWNEFMSERFKGFELRSF